MRPDARSKPKRDVRFLHEAGYSGPPSAMSAFRGKADIIGGQRKATAVNQGGTEKRLRGDCLIKATPNVPAA
jgi:hypothetical protein